MIIAKINGISILMNDKREFNIRTGNGTNKDITNIIDFTIHGNSYKEQKNSLRELAIEYQCSDFDNLSYLELAIITGYFHKNGKRYGLLEEFIENGII